MKRIFLVLILFVLLLPIYADEIDYFGLAKTMTADKLQLLIDDGLDVNAMLPNGLLPLELACLLSPYDVICTLLDNGADINASGVNKNGVLIALVCREVPMSVDQAKEMLRRVTDINAENIYGLTALCYAASRNNLKAVSLLIEFGADVNRITTSGYTPIWFANTIECMTLLIDAGADVNSVFEGEQGEYSLLGNVIYPSNDGTIPYEIAETLIKAGAEVNFLEPDGMTPFGYALEFGADQEFIDLMIRHGASAEYLNEKLLETLVGNVFSKPIDSATLDYLSYVKYPVDSRDNNGLTLLMHYLEYNEHPDIDTVARLLKMGANPNARDLYGDTPLLIAVADCQNVEIIKLLLNAGADVNARNEDLMTPLMASVSNKNAEVVSLMIKAGADINAQDKYEDSALHYASVDAVNPTVIDVLLNAGADATIVNDNGRKAFESANEYSDIYRTPAFWRLVDVSF